MILLLELWHIPLPFLLACPLAHFLQTLSHLVFPSWLVWQWPVRLHPSHLGLGQFGALEHAALLVRMQTLHLPQAHANHLLLGECVAWKGSCHNL